MDLNNAVAQISRCLDKGGYFILSDLRTGFGLKRNKIFRIFKHHSTNSYKHTLREYHSAFEQNGFKLVEFEKLKFDFSLVRRHKRFFYLAGLTIGYVFKLEKIG